MGEIDSCELNINMFNSIKNQTKDESDLLSEKTPLFIQQEPPRDWFKLTYVILFLHGIGHLLPWNMFITAHDYFSKRFTCPSSNDDDDLFSNSSITSHCHGFQDSFENYFSIFAMASVAVTSAVNIYIQSRIHFKYRMFTSLTIMFLLFVFTTIMVKVPTENWVDGFFAVSILTIVMMNLFSGLFQSSTFGFAGILPQEYTAAVMGGQAWAGLFSSVARIITTVAVPDNENYRLSAFFYFLSAALVTLICLLSFFVLMKLKFVKYHMMQTSVQAIREKQEAIVTSTVNVPDSTPQLPFFGIFQQIWIYALSVFLVFTVTISLFPAVISSIKSTHPYPDAALWTRDSMFDALVCFLLFNSSDFVGRYLSNWFKMPGKWQYLLFLLTLLRVLFIPLFIFCNVQPRSDRFRVPFHDDFIPVIFTCAFGLTNGFFASLSMVSAPGCVEPRYRETASTIMTWFLTLGLLCGAGLSFLFTYLVRI